MAGGEFGLEALEKLLEGGADLVEFFFRESDAGEHFFLQEVEHAGLGFVPFGAAVAGVGVADCEGGELAAFEAGELVFEDLGGGGGVGHLVVDEDAHGCLREWVYEACTGEGGILFRFSSEIR